MSSIGSFFSHNMTGVFFVYGLAFFAMGLAVALELRRPSRLLLAHSLVYLAAFGLLHSVTEWADMFGLIQVQSGTSDPVVFLQALKLFSLVGSTLLLIQFGVSLLKGGRSGYAWLGWLPVGLLLAWLTVSVGFSMAGEGLSSWPGQADIWARYILYFPGCLIAALGLVDQLPALRGSGQEGLGLSYRAAAAAFGLSAVLCGLIVPAGAYFPASALNYDSFAGLVGLPVQLFRATMAILIAIFVVKILRVFEVEHQRQLEAANRELEEKVLRRTGEIETLHRQLERLAVLEERDRIAREMHDGLAQVLALLNLKIRSVDSLLPKGKIEQASRELQEMGRNVQDAYTDVRESIFGLRLAAKDHGDLALDLSDYVRQFGQQNDLLARLEAEGLAEVEMPPGTETQLLRIVQEALSNVRKHAEATRAGVTVKSDGRMVLVVVEDDGVGFDATEVERRDGQHFGLETMRERAEGVGGTVEVDSEPGRGTRIVVRLPAGGQGG
jgi:signal transduction histidine kinase